MTDYDRVPYRSHPYLHAHVDHLAATATLFGLEPPPIERARVLEIGCGSGGNLLPMAAALPEAHFVGIDPAATTLAAARAAADAIGLTNVELSPIGVEDLADEGPFDYVIAHGVLSWIPEAARAALWRVVGERLAPDGVAYLSWNALPGWAIHGVVRDMTRWHVRDVTEPAERIARARAFLQALTDANPPKDEWGVILRAEQRRFAALSDWYAFHDHLAEHNRAFWFWEVEQTARAHGLAFLAEAELPRMVPDHLRPEARDALPRLCWREADLEQAMDFVRMQSFRETLFVRASAPIERPIDPDRLRALSFAFRARATEDGRWRTPEGVGVAATEPVANAVLTTLASARGRAMPFAGICDGVRSALGAVDERAVAENLLGALLGHEIVRAHRWPRSWLSVVTRCPVVWPFARRQAEAGGSYVTNLRHEAVPIDAFDRAVIARLDGRHDRTALTATLASAVERRELALEGEALDQRLLRTLVSLAHRALVVG